MTVIEGLLSPSFFSIIYTNKVMEYYMSNFLVKLAQQASKKDYAEGLPKKEIKGEVTDIKPEDILTFLVQQHLARKAGEHYDIRLGSPELGLLSWAARKGLPEPGGKARLAVRQPLHRFSYKDFEGEIPEGYGAGDVKKMLESAAVIHKVSPNQIIFTLGDERGGHRYSMVNTGDGKWLMKNVTPIESPLSKKELKPKLKPVEEQVDDIKILEQLRDKVTSPKLDGALATLIAKKKYELYSPRTRARSGYPITYTERLGLVGQDVPKELQDKTLRGELIAEKGGNILSPTDISGLLNMNLASMQKKLKEDDIRLRMGIFDLVEQGKTPEEKQQILKNIIGKLPKDKFFLVPKESDPKKAIEMYKQIKSGKHPMTQEGVVLEDVKGMSPAEKVKFLKEHDVKIKDIFKAQTKPGTKERAGGFTFEEPTDGKEVGRVGAGFSHEMLQDMLTNPDKYIGRTARIRALDKYPSGALRAPSFLALHEDY